MHRIVQIISAAALACAFASPALAGGRVELRGGALNDEGTNGSMAGIAAGYDFDLPVPVFFGAELSLDANLAAANAGNADVLIGVSVRAGTKVGLGGRLYVTGGQTIRSIDNAPYHLGGGYQQAIGPLFYVKGEYRHFFDKDLYTGGDSFVAGVGLKF